MKSQCDRILAVLADGREHSHHEFYGWCVLHSRVAELRKRGHRIEQRRAGDLYLYRLLNSAVAHPAEAAPVRDLANRALPLVHDRTGELERAPHTLAQLDLADDLLANRRDWS